MSEVRWKRIATRVDFEEAIQRFADQDAFHHLWKERKSDDRYFEMIDVIGTRELIDKLQDAGVYNGMDIDEAIAIHRENRMRPWLLLLRASDIARELAGLGHKSHIAVCNNLGLMPHFVPLLAR